jgi:hypothetical protein
MFSLFSKLIDYGVDSQFRRDLSGRLVFLPFGPRKTGFFVDSKFDEKKLRALVKMYRTAATLISWLVMGIYIYGLDGSKSHPSLRTVVVRALTYVLMLVVFTLIHWGIYKETIPSVTSSLPEAGSDTRGQLTAISPGPRRLALVFLAAGLVLAGLALAGLVMVGVRQPTRKTGACPPEGQAGQQLEVNPSHRPCMEQQ